MEHKDSENYKEWFKKANEDELGILALIRHDNIFPAIISFHAQQMAEKYLKGLLVYNNIRFPKVHDLVQLETLLAGLYPEVKDYNEDFDMLSTYYFETRYPGEYLELSKEEAMKAYEAAKKIKAFVLKKIGDGV